MVRKKIEGVYVVPKNQQKLFKNLVQRANRRILKNKSYADELEEGIFNPDGTPKRVVDSEKGRKALFGIYFSDDNLTGGRKPFSARTTFESKQAYEDFKDYINAWGKKLPKGNDDGYEKSIRKVRQHYYRSIMRALDGLVNNIDYPILNEKGKLPEGIRRAVAGLTVDQMANFFDEGDPTDDFEKSGFDSKKYYSTVENQQDFIDTVMQRIDLLKKVYPSNRIEESPFARKKKKRKPKIKISKKKIDTKQNAVSKGRKGSVRHGQSL